MRFLIWSRIPCGLRSPRCGTSWSILSQAVSNFVTDFVRSTEQSIMDRGLFSQAQRILVAVSGGADSMVLLHVLQRLSKGHAWKLVVGHFNHDLRGRSSDADERLVL